MYTQKPKYKVSKDGMFLIRLKDEKKIPIPSPIKLCNYAGLRTQLDVGTGGKSKAIRRSVIDESDFSLGDPAVEKLESVKGEGGRKKATRVATSSKVKGTKPTNGELRGAYEFYQRKLKLFEEEMLLTKQVMNRLAYDMQETLPFPEQSS